MYTRIVHLSFGFFDDSMPESVKETIRKLRRANPGWQIRVWGPKESRELVQEVDASFLQVFDGYKHPIQRSDASRYFILYRFGGLYMDLDYKIRVPLDELAASIESLGTDAGAGIVGLNETPNSVGKGSGANLSNSLMFASSPGHPFWTHVIACMRAMRRRFSFIQYFHIMYSTGPGLVTHAYRTWSGSAGVVLLPTESYNPCGMCSSSSTCSKSTLVLAYHRNGGSWSKSALDPMFRSMYCHQRLWCVIGALLVLAAVAIPIGMSLRTCPPCEKK